MTRVRCYAGARYPERPVAFEWEGRWLDIAELAGQARTPEGLLFDVLAEDGRRYRLAWHAETDEWAIMPASGKSIA
jgi:hypothetical protein